ncbi:alpha/beta hydrolase [Amaricoccus sp.]|uniref:alpha/beta hydrolase n=1 Tax=Amaricoccus sp. TaxID=1872485 RepID=UPI001B58A400|nr:alpha/beta hydrolase [Amaricoccus sp.]MBP7000021.1 alpha/beta hydrolase [Amaricoccus sp.]
MRFAGLAALVVLVLIGCSRPPELIGVDNPEAPALSLPDLDRHRLFIMTTREATEVVGALYSAERAPDLGLASVEVTVPPTHLPGQLERPRRLPPDPRTQFAVVDPVVYHSEAAFISRVDEELAARPRGQRRILLFVHGYNNTTSDALLRLSQFVEDTGFPGVPVLFTWASAARAPRYVYDLNSALVARVQIKHMAEILSRTDAESLDVFAHSMGAFLTMEGLVDAAQTGQLGRRNRINQIILASPDIDIDLFRTQLAQLPQDVRERMYLLVSKDDGALRFSRRIAGGVPRVGAADTAELEDLGLTVIDLSEIDDSSSGSHSKFAGSPEVVRLIGAGLNSVGGFDAANTPGLDEILADVPIRILGD